MCGRGRAAALARERGSLRLHGHGRTARPRPRRDQPLATASALDLERIQLAAESGDFLQRSARDVARDLPVGRGWEKPEDRFRRRRFGRRRVGGSRSLYRHRRGGVDRLDLLRRCVGDRDGPHVRKLVPGLLALLRGAGIELGLHLPVGIRHVAVDQRSARLGQTGLILASA